MIKGSNKGLIRKVCRGIILLLILCTLLGVSVFAEDGGTGGSGTGGSGGGTGSGSVINGPSYKKTGFVFYIVDGSGNIVAEPKARVSLNVYPNNSQVNYVDTRFGGRTAVSVEGSIQECHAWGGYTPFNSSSSGNGGKIKNHLISNGANGKPEAVNFIQYYWGENTADAFLDNDDQYLMIEPFLWTSLYKGSTYLGNVVGTSLGWVTVREENGSPESSSNSTYTLGNLPNSMAFDIPVLGVPAPTSLSGKRSYVDIKSFGYGIISIWSSEIGTVPDIPEDVAQNNADAIKANELNYIYKNFSGSRSGSKDGFEVKKIDMNSYRSHASDHNASIDDYTVTDNKSGDLWFFKGNDVLFYRPSTGLWAESSASKSFGKDDMVYPQYTYNISRTLWQDDLVLCNYRDGSNNRLSSTYVSYADSLLGITAGNTGSITGVSAGTNNEATYGVSKADAYSYKGSTTERWQEWVSSHTDNADGTTTDTSHYEDKSEIIESEEISYSVNHFVDKYKVADTGVVSNGSAGDIAIELGVGGRAKNKVGYTVQSSSILTVDPEIKMTMYYTTQTGTFYDSVVPMQVYVMGEYLRKCTPAVVNYYNAYLPGTVLKGNTIVDSAMTGTRAFEWEATWARDGAFQDFYQVAAQGSGFETATTNNPVVSCITFGLDVQEEVNGESVRSAWGNSVDIKSMHDSFVQTLNDSLTTEVEAQRYGQDGNAFGEKYEMSYDISDSRISYLGKEQVKITYKDGMIQNRSEIVSKIVFLYGVSTSEADTAFTNSGIEQQLDDMFVTNADADNGSRNKWYSEESITMCITFHKSSIAIGQILLNDKTDYGSSTNQSLTEMASIGSSGVQVRYYFSLLFDTDYLDVNGSAFETSPRKYLIDSTEIRGARFLISNMTTNNWRK